MVSREQDGASTLHEKLQVLRSITHSHALVAFLASKKELFSPTVSATRSVSVLNKTAIIVDASRYIEGLKQTVETLNQDVEEFAGCSSGHSRWSPIVHVTVEALEKGFLIDVFSHKSCPGLLVSILEALEELGLDVLEARVSCTDGFRLQAVGGESEEQGGIIGSQVVRRAVLQAIKKWKEGSDD